MSATQANPLAVAMGTNKLWLHDSVPPSQWTGIPELSFSQVVFEADMMADLPVLQMHQASLSNAGSGHANLVFDGMPGNDSV